MKIRITKKHGDVVVTEQEIISSIYDQLLMIPGVRNVGEGSVLKRLTSEKSISIYQIRTNAIGITISIRLDQFVNIIELAKDVQETIKFVIEKKYGIIVDHVDVKIEGIEHAK